MSAWSNTDSIFAKPKFDFERQVRRVADLPLAVTVSSGNLLTFNGTDVANANIQVGFYADSNGVGYAGGKGGFLFSNNTVSAVTANTVTLTNPVYATANSGQLVKFSKAITFKANSRAATYASDTILVTPTRIANSVANVGISVSPGWARFTTKTVSNGLANSSTRIIGETLVTMNTPVASNTGSGNTSFGQIYSGV